MTLGVVERDTTERILELEAQIDRDELSPGWGDFFDGEMEAIARGEKSILERHPDILLYSKAAHKTMGSLDGMTEADIFHLAFSHARFEDLMHFAKQGRKMYRSHDGLVNMGRDYPERLRTAAMLHFALIHHPDYSRRSAEDNWHDENILRHKRYAFSSMLELAAVDRDSRVELIQQAHNVATNILHSVTLEGWRQRRIETRFSLADLHQLSVIHEFQETRDRDTYEAGMLRVQEGRIRAIKNVSGSLRGHYAALNGGPQTDVMIGRLGTASGFIHEEINLIEAVDELGRRGLLHEFGIRRGYVREDGNAQHYQKGRSASLKIPALGHDQTFFHVEEPSNTFLPTEVKKNAPHGRRPIRSTNRHYCSDGLTGIEYLHAVDRYTEAKTVQYSGGTGYSRPDIERFQDVTKPV
ncbi:MAG: hypothetical protein R3313_05310, partial [Candidatus Saccharimonadales bacterium]|nr:hypothetical protein [Candidatus Saccharimonadales bacterium]